VGHRSRSTDGEDAACRSGRVPAAQRCRPTVQVFRPGQRDTDMVSTRGPATSLGRGGTNCLTICPSRHDLTACRDDLCGPAKTFSFRNNVWTPFFSSWRWVSWLLKTRRRVAHRRRESDVNFIRSVHECPSEILKRLILHIAICLFICFRALIRRRCADDELAIFIYRARETRSQFTEKR